MWQAKTHRKAKCYGGDVDVVDMFWLRLLGSARPGCQHEGRDGILRASGAAVRLRGPAEKNPGKAISHRARSVEFGGSRGVAAAAASDAVSAASASATARATAC